MVERNREVAEDKHIVFRIGLNVGSGSFEDGDVFGDGVNVKPVGSIRYLPAPCTISKMQT